MVREMYEMEREMYEMESDERHFPLRDVEPELTKRE